jgi:hypothetical protein
MMSSDSGKSTDTNALIGIAAEAPAEESARA